MGAMPGGAEPLAKMLSKVTREWSVGWGFAYETENCGSIFCISTLEPLNYPQKKFCQSGMIVNSKS